MKISLVLPYLSATLDPNKIKIKEVIENIISINAISTGVAFRMLTCLMLNNGQENVQKKPKIEY